MATLRTVSSLLLLAFACAGCGPGEDAQTSKLLAGVDEPVAAVQARAADELDTDSDVDQQVSPSTGELLPMPFAAIWEPWVGDYDAMVDRRVIRVLVPYGGYQFYYDNGQPKGAVYDLVQRFEAFVNEELGRKNVKVYVVVIPVSRDELLPALEQGHADFVAADLTITDDRAAQFTFSRPLLTGINEIIVTGPASPAVDSLDALAGKEIVVRRSSSYYEHLQRLSSSLQERGLDAPVIRLADELLESEDILETLNAGMFAMTVMDDYKARFWSEIFTDLVVREDLIINEGGSIAWATRADSPGLTAIINRFLREFGKGTLVGNVTFDRYLADASRVRCAYAGRSRKQMEELADVFRQYGERFEFDWLMLAAQGLQESGLRQERRSPAGAVGVMQIKPSTAADRNVGIDDVSTVDANVHAAAKYMRFLADRYFDGDGVNDLNQWLLSLAAYNAGPSRVARLRREAGESGYDPDIWFDNVEIIAARRIGRETVTYVSNIFKYYVGYQITQERSDIRAERHADTLSVCAAELEG